jgi:hypothetical protein
MGNYWVVSVLLFSVQEVVCIVEDNKKKLTLLCSSHMTFFAGSLSIKNGPCSFFYHSFIGQCATWFCELCCLHFIGQVCLNFRVFFVALSSFYWESVFKF